MSKEAIAALMSEVLKALESGDVESMVGFYAEDGADEDFGFNTVIQGREQIREYYGQIFQALPTDYSLEAVAIGEDNFMMTWEMRGVHERDFAGIPPTGKPFVIKGATLCTVNDANQVVRATDYWNFADLLVQLGVTTIPPALRPSTELGAAGAASWVPPPR